MAELRETFKKPKLSLIHYLLMIVIFFGTAVGVSFQQIGNTFLMPSKVEAHEATLIIHTEDIDKLKNGLERIQVSQTTLTETFDRELGHVVKSLDRLEQRNQQGDQINTMILRELRKQNGSTV